MAFRLKTKTWERVLVGSFASNLVSKESCRTAFLRLHHHHGCVRHYSFSPRNAPRQYFRAQSQTPPRYNTERTRRLFVWGTIGANIVVFVMWQSAIRVSPSAPQSAIIEARRQARIMVDNFTLSQRNLAEGRYYTILTSAFSHRDLGHLFFNMLVFSFTANLGFRLGLGATRMVVLATGSTLASGAGSILNERTRKTGDRAANHLGASGMIQGLMVAMALRAPQLPVMLMFIPIPIPFWVATAGFLAYDMYNLTRERKHGSGGRATTVGYAAHLSGAAFGALYYFARLRYRF